MKIATFNHVSFAIINITGTEGIVVPFVPRLGPCPTHYAWTTDEGGEVLLHGSAPDTWVEARGGSVEDAVATAAGAGEEVTEEQFLGALTAWDSGSGSVGGWEHAGADRPWSSQARAVADACRLPTWLPPLLEGDFGEDGPLAHLEPQIRWLEVADRCAKLAESRMQLHAPDGAVAEVRLAGVWGLDSQVQWSAADLPLGLRIACVEAGVGFQLSYVRREVVKVAPVAAPVTPTGEEAKPRQERPRHRRQRDRDHKPQPQQKPPAPAPQPAVEPGPPVVLTPVVIHEAMLSMIPVDNHDLFRSEVEKEVMKAGGEKATEGARKRAIQIAFNRVRAMRAPLTGLSRAERKAETKKLLTVVQGGAVEPAHSEAAKADLLVAEEVQAVAELDMRMDQLDVRAAALEAACAATDALFDSVMGEGAAEAIRVASTLSAPKTIEQIEAESVETTALFEKVMGVGAKVKEEQAQAELFLELDESLRATAAARVAAGEPRELVILDLLTAPVAEAPAKPAKAKPVRKDSAEKAAKPTRKKAVA